MPTDNLAIQTTCDKISTAVNKYSKYIEGKSFTDRDQLKVDDEMNEATVHFDNSKLAIYETKPTETDLEPWGPNTSKQVTLDSKSVKQFNLQVNLTPEDVKL